MPGRLPQSACRPFLPSADDDALDTAGFCHTIRAKIPRPAMRQLLQIDDWTVAARDESTTFSPDPDHEFVYSFDLEGRPISWFEDESVYKRSLASVVHGREQMHGPRRRWIVPDDEARVRFGRLLERIAGFPEGKLPPDLRARWGDIVRWTPESLLSERAKFEAAYEPIAILPPDQYLAVVLQATFGCSWNQCTFCDFYQDRPFRARTLEELDLHFARVATLLGRGERTRKWIFLADGNALILSNDRLLPLFDRARAAFPGRSINGFLDVFTGERKPVADWVALRERGLERVHLGIETGDDELLAFMNKPGSAEAALDLVATLAAAGLKLSVIFMCGVGGDRFAEAHAAATLDLVRRMPLAAHDIVYLSPFVEHPDSAYAARAHEAGIAALDDAARDAQYRRLRDGIRTAHPKARVTLYDIREFIY